MYLVFKIFSATQLVKSNSHSVRVRAFYLLFMIFVEYLFIRLLASIRMHTIAGCSHCQRLNTTEKLNQNIHCDKRRTMKLNNVTFEAKPKPRQPKQNESKQNKSKPKQAG